MSSRSSCSSSTTSTRACRSRCGSFRGALPVSGLGAGPPGARAPPSARAVSRAGAAGHPAGARRRRPSGVVNVGARRLPARRIFMRLAFVVALALFAASAGAQDPVQSGSAGAGGRTGSSHGSKAPEARKSPPLPAAAALARALLPQEQWDRILDRYATSLSSQVAEALSRGGEKVPDDLRGSVRRELAQRLPYQETVNAQALALAKEFSPDE